MILPANPATTARAAAIIATGGLIAFRTDTFYGLGTDPFNQAAVRALRELKAREEAKPVLVVLSDADVATRFMAERTTRFTNLCAHCWPGALTLVVAARPDVPVELTAQTGTIGLRLPADEEVRALVRACGGALTATSANVAGAPPARTASEVAQAFPTGLALIVDGGAARTEQPSTVLDVRGERVRLIREGVVSWREIKEIIEDVEG